MGAHLEIFKQAVEILNRGEGLARALAYVNDNVPQGSFGFEPGAPSILVAERPPLEVNGLANIVMHVNAVKEGTVPLDLDMIKSQAEKQIKYLTDRDANQFRYWHETKG